MKGYFWRRDILKLLDTFKGLARVQVQDGRTVQLWHDLWNNQIHKVSSQELFSFSGRPNVTLKNVGTLQNLFEIFHLPLSEQAY
jgi:hypothetical protein